MALDQATFNDAPRASDTDDRYVKAVAATLLGRRAAIDEALVTLFAGAGSIAAAAALLIEALRAGHKVLVAGNGGSASEAQHFAAELVGRFQHDRAPYAALALSADSSTLTAVANDFGYADVFARQVRALGQPGDVLVAFSTSGESENLLRAADVARERGLSVVAVTGKRRSRLGSYATVNLQMPVDDTALVQELHLMITHALCGVVEAELDAVGAP